MIDLGRKLCKVIAQTQAKCFHQRLQNSLWDWATRRLMSLENMMSDRTGSLVAFEWPAHHAGCCSAENPTSPTERKLELRQGQVQYLIPFSGRDQPLGEGRPGSTRSPGRTLACRAHCMLLLSYCGPGSPHFEVLPPQLRDATGTRFFAAARLE